jgi:hypothetical protein
MVAVYNWNAGVVRPQMPKVVVQTHVEQGPGAEGSTPSAIPIFNNLCENLALPIQDNLGNPLGAPRDGNRGYATI